MLKAFVGILGLGVCCFTSRATAQTPDGEAPSHTVNPAPQRSEARRLPPRRWYGWQGLAVDGAALGLATAALFVQSGETQHAEDVATWLVVGGLVAYGVGGPTFHLVHQQPWHALGSLGMRGAFPILGALAFRSTVTCPRPGDEDYGNCGAGQLIGGLAVGAVVAMALDATLLGWDRPEREVAQARFGLAPVISKDGRRELRLVGAF